MITHEHRQSYPSDLKDHEWEVLQPYFSRVSNRGRPLEYHLREIINAILYVLRTGCAWRMMPHDLPPWQTVYYHFRKWRKEGTWEQINRQLSEGIVRTKDGSRPPVPGLLTAKR